METISLKNGMRVALASNGASVYTVSVTVNLGHINEPKLGIASLFEKVLMLQAPFVQAVYGGTITTFLTGCAKEDLKETMEKMANLVKAPELSEELLQKAKKDTIERTELLAKMPARQSKLAYKHVAFSKRQLVWNTDEYIAVVESVTVEDLKALHEKYYTGKNLVLCVAGEKPKKTDAEKLARELFAEIPEGKRYKADNELYTGGFEQIASSGGYQRVMFGWNATYLSGVSEANVLMSALNGQLERAFASMEAKPELKIAGYFGGMRTLRISVETWQPDADLNAIINTVADIVKKLQEQPLDEYALESARQWAMTEKLFKFASPNDASVETAWQILGREKMYDVDERIIATWRVSARDVQDIAQEIFSTPLTYVVISDKEIVGYDDVMKKLR